MPLISFKDADHYLETGKPPWPPIFLLYGEEVLYKKILDQLLQALLGDASRTVNYEPIEGLNENVPAALAAVNTYSLLAAPKVVALTDARLFLSRRNEESLWQKAYDAARNENPARAARHFRDGLSLRRLTWEDLEGRDDWQALLGASPGGEDWSWALPVVAYCHAKALNIPQASDPAQALETALARGFPAGHHLIITTSWIDKRRTLFKTFKDQGVIIDCSVPGGERKADRNAQAVVLDGTVDHILARHKKKMGRDARQALYALTGFDLRTVAANVEKLVNFSGERPEISSDDVRRTLARTRRDPLYEFTNAVTDRDLERSLFYLRSLIDSGEFDHPLPLLAAVTNQVRKLIMAKDFARSTYGQEWRPGCSYPQFQQRVLPALKAYDAQLLERLAAWQTALKPVVAVKAPKKGRAAKNKITSDLPLMGRSRSPYPVYRTLAKADRFTRRELLAALSAVSQADRRLKRTGPGGRLILEQVIIGICQRHNYPCR
jgi:DNA polymerase-3 subunit delta